MDAVKFLEELQRICSGRTTCCGCDLYVSGGKGCRLASNPDKWVKDEIERLILIVEKWSAEHPRKTRLQDFMKKCPNALTTTKGVPMASPRLMGYCEGKDYDMACLSCEHGKKGLEFCWNLPLEE